MPPATHNAAARDLPPGLAAGSPWTAALQPGWGALAAAVAVGVTLAFYAGAPFHPSARLSQLPAAWTMAVLQFGLPLVLALRLADLAVERGRSPVLAYGAVIPLVIFVGAFVIWRPFWPWLPPWVYTTRPPSLLECFGEGSRLWLPITLGVVAYAHWRQAQRSQRRIAQRRLQQAQRHQQMQAAQLLALQARVEPQLLFDTLQRITRLADTDPAAAEALLGELIALLRAMLPEPDSPGSTVEREFALVRAYAKVTGDAALLPPALALSSTPDAARATLAPMVLLPLLRALTPAGAAAWQVSAELTPTAAPGLRLTLRARAPASPEALAALRAVDDAVPAQLQAHLAAVHGSDASIALTGTGVDTHWLIDIPNTHAASPDR